MPRDRDVPPCPCACTPSGRGPAPPLQEPESPRIARTRSGCPLIGGRSGAGARAAPKTAPRNPCRCSSDPDNCASGVRAVAVSIRTASWSRPCSATLRAFTTAGTRRARTSHPRGEPVPWMTCGTRLHQADGDGCSWSPVRNRGASSSRRRGDRLWPCLPRVWPRFATGQERPLTETVPSTGRRPTGPVS